MGSSFAGLSPYFSEILIIDSWTISRADSSFLTVYRACLKARLSTPSRKFANSLSVAIVGNIHRVTLHLRLAHVFSNGVNVVIPASSLSPPQTVPGQIDRSYFKN